MAKRKRKPTLTQSIMSDVKDMCETIYENANSRKQSYRHFKKFLLYCRENFFVKSFEECKEHIQSYANYLVECGYSSFSVHTFLSSPCRLCGVPMNEIQKPKRRICDITRGRKSCKDSMESDLDNPRWSYLIEFQKSVGIRRNELKHLTSSDWLIENGNLYVYVRKGKGGKKQKQFIRPKDAEFIKSYFLNAKPGERIFDESLFNNNLNLHKLRAQNAYAMYLELLEAVKKDKSLEVKIRKDITKRWYERKKKPIPKSLIEGYYTLRGENRALAKKLNRPLSYSKLLVLWCSINLLSHYRLNVAICHYFLL